MSQIKKKFIENQAIDESKILLLNDGAMKARNAADSADVELFKLDSSNKLQLLVLPQVSADPVAANDLVRKSHLDGELSTAASNLSAVEGRVTAIENDYGVAGGLATLDGAGLIPSAQLPSYVDDVLEYANLAAFPATGETGKIYVAIDTSKCYRWSGSVYVYITSGAVDSVNSKTGVVVLATGDIAESGSTNLYYTPTRQTAIEGYADAAVAVEKGRAEAAEGALASRATALENASVQFVQQKFTLTGTDITNGYIALSNLAIQASINAFVDRLAIHETDDYTVSTVSGVTRMTFAGALITPGLEKLAAGDVVTVKYAKKAI